MGENEDTEVNTALNDFNDFRDVMNPELQAGFDKAMDVLTEADVQFVVRALVLAIQFGRKIQTIDTQPKIILPH